MAAFRPALGAISQGSPGHAHLSASAASSTPPGTPSPAFALPPPAQDVAAAVDFHELVKTLRIFISCVERYPNDPVAAAVASRASAPLAQATELCVRGVLEECKLAASSGDCRALLSAIWFLREFCEASASARSLIRQYGGTQMLLGVLMNPQIDKHVLRECVKLLDCLEGFEGLLEAVKHAQQKSPAALVQLLWHVRDRTNLDYEQPQQVPPINVLRVAMASFEAYPDYIGVHDAALALVADFLSAVEFRGVFCEAGGWPYVLTVLERHRDSIGVQRRGLQLICQLQRGGVFSGEYTKRAAQAVMQCLSSFHDDRTILEWGLWLLVQLGGTLDLLPLLAAAGESSVIALAVLRALQRIEWGQTQSADIALVPEVVKSVGAAMLRALHSAWSAALELGVPVLINAGREVALLPEAQLHPNLAVALRDSVEVVLEVLRQRVLDVAVVEHCVEVVRIYQDAAAGSSIRDRIRETLIGGPCPTLLIRLGDSHVSSETVQSKVLWAQGAILGPGAVIDVMERLAGSWTCESSGTKTLGMLFEDFEDLDASAREARAPAVRALMKVMNSWPRDHSLLAHACFALSAIATHGLDPEGGAYTVECLQHGLEAAWRVAVPLATELDREDCQYARTKARCLRREVARLELETMKVAPQPWRQKVQAEALRIGVAATLCESLVRDSSTREINAETILDAMRLALCSFGASGQVEATVRVIQRGGVHGWSLVQAAAEAAVDLCRLGLQQELRQAGLLEAARSVKQELLGRSPVARARDRAEPVIRALQFAEDWAGR